MARSDPDPQEVILNDAQSALNATRVARLIRPERVDDIVDGRPIGGRRRRAGSASREFASRDGRSTVRDRRRHIDMRGMTRLVGLDDEAGDRRRGGRDRVGRAHRWPPSLGSSGGSLQTVGHRQKQTGSDHLSLGGAIAADVHGRGLTQRPIVADIESFTLVDPHGVRSARSTR